MSGRFSFETFSPGGWLGLALFCLGLWLALGVVGVGLAITVAIARWLDRPPYGLIYGVVVLAAIATTLTHGIASTTTAFTISLAGLVAKPGLGVAVVGLALCVEVRLASVVGIPYAGSALVAGVVILLPAWVASLADWPFWAVSVLVGLACICSVYLVHRYELVTLGLVEGTR